MNVWFKGLRPWSKIRFVIVLTTWQGPYHDVVGKTHHNSEKANTTAQKGSYHDVVAGFTHANFVLHCFQKTVHRIYTTSRMLLEDKRYIYTLFSPFKISMFQLIFSLLYAFTLSSHFILSSLMFFVFQDLSQMLKAGAIQARR